MNKRLMTAGAASLVAVFAGCALFAPKTYDGVDIAPGEMHAKDLCELKNVRSVAGEPIESKPGAYWPKGALYPF